MLTVVYDELRRLAASELSQETPGQTLQTTALVHEAYLRLVKPTDGGDDQAEWHSRGHFFAAAAEAMRRILIDNARRKNRLRHGGEHERVDWDLDQLAGESLEIDLIELDEALCRLEGTDSRKAKIVKLRFFAGFSLEEIATTLQLSVPTVHRDWRYARAWLRRAMEDNRP